MTVYTASRSRVKLGPELARGGEAVVYRISGNGDLLAKIYSKPRPDYHGPGKAGKGAIGIQLAEPVMRRIGLRSILAWCRGALGAGRGRERWP